MKTVKKNVHFLHNELLRPANPILVNVIGAGGTGSKFMTALMEINHSLLELGHSGLDVHLWDDDIVTPANVGRQRFAESEKGLYKSIAIINRLNRWSGFNWKAETQKFERDSRGNVPENALATIYISCTDNVRSRFEIADIARTLKKQYSYLRDSPKYWLDFGNSKFSGQVVMSTIGKIEQPRSKMFTTVAELPFVTDEFSSLLRESEKTDNTPSCSLAESLDKQDLFINATLAQMGASLLWNLLKSGMTEHRGMFLNLENFRTQPITVGS
ncbi:PRTRC system ThiF family protein [Chryseobacterium kwangjuense]|uniref:Thiamine biosynthesis protein ThiF n=1 Tax=Chryseobacterium kwangjuense TaxID=267125 RepID=A0A135WIW0_9FLAO|nr:PRTRC system ThiF family protein [Chryseobacterium kwangjuense]KXH84868.1 thiamine biosynthesis protein ThiF [Chryseobacterium kwangjuense]